MASAHPPTTTSPARRLAASASLGISAAGFAVMAVHDARFAAPWGLLAFTAVVAAASAGLARRSVLAQVLSRGVAWVVLAPTFIGVVGSLLYGHAPELWTATFAGSSGAALLLARPALHTGSARREFAPVAYRTWFLAGAVASAMAGVVAALGAVEMFTWASTKAGMGLAALASVLLASAVGVVRMRAWGVLLGVLTAAITLAAALFADGELGTIGLALAAIPGAVLAVPLVAARLRPEPALVRPAFIDPLAGEGRDEAPPTHTRVRVVSEPEQDEVPACTSAGQASSAR